MLDAIGGRFARVPGEVEIRDLRGEREYPELLRVWRSAVDATHDFLSDEHRSAIEARLVPDYFPNVHLSVAEIDGQVVGFAGTAAGKLELLFVDAARRGSGIGSTLLCHAIAVHDVTSVDVNEQNAQAVGFYERMGFTVTGRSPVDGDGLAYPLVHMSADTRGTEVTIRCGEVADIPALLDFWAVAGENAARPGDDAALIENLLDRDPQALLVAERDGGLVGSVIAGWDGWRAHLYRLAVDPQTRGQRIGRRLVEAAEERLRTLGAIRFDAMVLSDNALGAAAWTALGYRPQDDWTRWVKPA